MSDKRYRDTIEKLRNPEQIRAHLRRAGLKPVNVVELTNVNLYLMDIVS